MNRLGFFILVVAALTGCARTTDISGSAQIPAGIQADLSASTLTFVNHASGKPLVGAKVMIGTKPDIPYVGNVYTTDAQGKIDPGPAWTNAQPITVELQGFIRTTFMAQSPSAKTLNVNRQIPLNKFELKGETKGYGSLPQDGTVDVGFVMPAYKRSEIAQISITSLMSPETDTLSVMGRSIEIPSNIAIPTQKESYIFTFTLSKPVYRFYFNEARSYDMISAHASFPLSEAIDASQQKMSFYDMFNLITFHSATVTNLAISAQTQSLDLSINKTPFSTPIPFTAPQFDANKLKLIAIGLNSSQGVLVPTDIKSLDPKQTIKLSGSGKLTDSIILSMIRDAKNKATTGTQVEEYSLAIQPANQTSSSSPLALIAAPKLQGNVMTMAPPSIQAGVDTTMTQAQLQQVEIRGQGKYQVEAKLTEWEVYASGWQRSLELPEFPGAQFPRQDRRWEVVYGGVAGGTSTSAGPETMGQLTHLTRAAVKY